MSKIKAIAKTAAKTVSDQSPTILTGLAVAGTAATVYLAARAGYRSAILISEDEHKGGISDDWKENLRRRARLTWKEYIPSVSVGAVTILCTVGANRISSNRAAALAGAYNLTAAAFQEYKTKVVETIGENKAARIHDDIAQDRMQSDPVQGKDVIITFNGDVLCYDHFTGRYFQSSMNAIRKAENELNYQIIHDVYASLNDWYRRLEIPRVDVGDDLGWDDKVEIKVSTQVSDDDRPCLVVRFERDPKRDYYKVW